MDLVLFPGNHPGILNWTREVEDQIEVFFDSTFVQEYKYRETRSDLIIIEKELERMEKWLKGKNHYAFLALSVGTLIVLKGVHEGRLAPDMCIFVGTAIESGRRMHNDIDLWINDYRIPTLFIQKTKDPACNFQYLKSLFEDSCANKCEFVEIPGDEHYYENIELIKDKVASYITKF